MLNMITFVIVKMVKRCFFKLFMSLQLCFVAVNIYGQTPKNQIDPVLLAKVLAKANHEITTKTSSVIGEGDYLFLGDSLFVNPNGTHYIYSYNFKRNTFIRQDHSTFHGHNFGRTLFLYNNDIYAFGGYGFWANHTKLIKFDRISKEWDLVIIKNLEPNKFQSIFTAKIGDSLYLYGTYEHHATQKKNQTSTRLFIINLRDFSSQEYENLNLRFIERSSSDSYNSQNSKYVIWGSPNTIDYILDKSTGIYYKNASGPSFFSASNPKKENYQDSFYRFVIGKDLISVNPDYTVEKLDLENYIKLFCLPENKTEDWHMVTNEDNNQTILIYQIAIAVLIIALVLLFLINFRRDIGFSKKIYKYYEFLDNQDSIVQAILSIGSGEYSEKEMDMILRITHLPKSLRKIKRSQIIFAINEKHPTLIEKLEYPNGKDFIYLIRSITN